MTNGESRSVSAGGNISRSIIQTGDHNRADLKTVQLPPPEAVDIASEVAALRAELVGLAAPDADKISRALEDAEEEAGKPDPDKKEIAGSIERALGYARKAGDFSEHIEKIQALVTRIGGWIGAASPYAGPLLASVGLAPL